MNNNFSPYSPIVMVDDNEIDALIAKNVYRLSGLAQPFVVLTSGVAVLEYLEEVAEGAKPMPAAVLLDINMPFMNGFEVLETIRSQERFAEMPVIMMLTNSDSPMDRDRAYELGANGYQTKPADIGVYTEFMQRLIA